MQVTSDLVVGFLVARRRCTDCGGRYEPQDICVLGRHGPSIWELAAVCRACCTMSLIQAVVHRGPARTHRRAAIRRTELTPAEDYRFGHLPPIRRDDVLDATVFLAAFDGDFGALFGPLPDGW
jgi:hypothetical protein